MKFDILDAATIISHWVLEDIAHVDAIIQTPEWKKDRTTVAKVTVNGVELPFESLEKFIYSYLEGREKSLTDQFADLDREAQRRVEKILQERADGALEMMDKLTVTLREVGTILKPYWEK